MPRHQDKDVSFEAPAEWADRTFVAFTAPPEAAANKESAPNIVMTREPMRPGDTLRTHADRQLLELGKQLKDFDLLESRETELAGQAAIVLRYAWVSHFGALEQSMTLVVRPGESGHSVTTFTTTTTPQDAGRARPLFTQILETVRFESNGAPPPKASSPTTPTTPQDQPPLVPMPGFRGGPGSRR
jgi:hypothetical protein